MVPTVFIASYERPIYLWATLDSLYRHTRSPANFILIDSGSRDPMVHQVIDGFDRRGMFQEVIRHPENNDDWADPYFTAMRPRLGEVFYYLDADVIVLDSGRCWLEAMARVMDEKPRMAMLGSKIDKSDFVDQPALERRLGRALTGIERKQIKFRSPERNLPDIGPSEVASPFNPPGRLLALRTDPIHDLLGTVMRYNDGRMHEILLQHGWETGIYGGVVHRHLSLCNYFDYPEYSMPARDLYYSVSSRR